MVDPSEQMRQSCKAIQNSEFVSPGMFTTSLLAHTDPLRLIRDALPAEKSLFHIVKASGMSSVAVPAAYNDTDTNTKNNTSFVDLKPVRTDGKSIFIDPDVSFNDTTAIRVPSLVSSSKSSLLQTDDMATSPTRRRVSQLEARPDLENSDIDSLFNALKDLMDRNPDLEEAAATIAKASTMKQEYATLTSEIKVLEHSLAEQERRLQFHQGIMPSMGEMSVPEMIEHEEREIARLETESI